MKVIWLTSWYPNPLRPYDGDFIQRHARAISSYVPVNVFYVDQSGHKIAIAEDKIMKHRDKNLVERIIFFKFKPTGIDLLDKLRYNHLYFKTYKKAIRNYIVKKGKPDLVHIHIPMKAGMIGKWIKRTYKIPYVISEHSVHYQMDSPDDFFKKTPRHRKQVESIFRNAVAVTNVSAAMAQKLQSIFHLAAVRIIRNTVDTTLFKFRPAQKDIFRFIHISTLDERQKNIQGIFEAVEELSKQKEDFEFVVVGPATSRLKQETERRNLTKWIRFTGEIAYERVAMELQSANALVLFSRYENFPCVIIEALCTGIPVISSNTGGIAEAIDQDNGLLVQSGQTEELTAAMLKMMSEYDKFNGQAISRKAQDEYGYLTIGKKFFELYREVLGMR